MSSSESLICSESEIILKKSENLNSIYNKIKKKYACIIVTDTLNHFYLLKTNIVMIWENYL